MSRSSAVNLEPSEQCARGTIVKALHDAAKQLWGDAGVKQIGQLLPAEVRQKTVDTMVLPVAWCPERFVLAWFEAAFAGPAMKSQVRFEAFLDAMMNHGFGSVRKFLLKMASPKLVLEKAATLWRHDHSAGTLECTIDGHSAQLILRDHVYTTTPLSRSALAEIYRYAISLTGVKPSATHYLRSDGAFVVSLKW